MTTQELMNALAEPFPVSELEINPYTGFVYIAWTAVVNRFNSLLQLDWEIVVREVTCKPKDQGGATALVDINIYHEGRKITRSGVGACSFGDEDTSIKGAQAEALKKAAQQFGVGIYLFDKKVAARAKLERLISDGKELEAVKALAELEGVAMKDVRQHYGIPAEITDKNEIAKAVLIKKGLLMPDFQTEYDDYREYDPTEEIEAMLNQFDENGNLIAEDRVSREVTHDLEDSLV